MGLLGQVSSAVSKTSHGLRPSKEDRAPEGASADDTEELDEESGNVLMSLISQLRIGMDLSKVTLPTFVLEPRSMLERITDFLSHPELIFGADQLANPEDRFLAVLAYYMSGWHIKPKGVKKPYNPVLGEFYRCSYTYPNGTTAHYIAEQVSHHPPISAYYYISPENNLLIYGDLRPKSKFLGNSAATLMGGESCVALLGQPGDGEYRISMPNMYARGIMFGKMVLELGDTSRVTNRANDIQSDVEFKVKVCSRRLPTNRRATLPARTTASVPRCSITANPSASCPGAGATRWSTRTHVQGPRASLSTRVRVV